MTNRYRITLLFAILSGFALRLYRFGSESLWYDETVTVVLARKNIPSLIAHTAGDIHPPGYYLLLHVWDRLTHPTLYAGLEFLFAWPSLFFGTLILPLLFAIGTKIHTPQIGLLALFLGSINPFHIWYSQEVRMYTLGATLGLICLWSLLDYFSDKSDDLRNVLLLPLSRLLGYILAAAAGIYSLYYFAFALIGLNVVAAALVWQSIPANGRTHLRKIALWLAAQIVVILLWSPWIPIFWRQATDPPVPPWRVEWTLAQLGADLIESFSALLVGQTAAAWFMPLFALIAVITLGFYVATIRPPRSSLLLYLLVPILLIYLLTAFVTPLYHVRYLFIYAPVFMIILAVVIVRLEQKSPWLAGGMLVALVLANLIGLARFWHLPIYQTDNHRGAVAQLASQWRPSDLILVNAGWAYTVIDTYWPIVESENSVAVAPPIADSVRLLDVSPIGDSVTWPESGQAPLVVRSGSVNAAENLGWGDPQSDFFSITDTETTAALTSLASCYRRIWHYRIYDTVSDPNGVIRKWLMTNSDLQSEQWISGRDLGQLRLFNLHPAVRSNISSHCEPAFIPWEPVEFGNLLTLTSVAAPSFHNPQQPIYVTLEWVPLGELANEETPLAMSLRLYADVDTLIAQKDETPSPQTVAWLNLASNTKRPIRHLLSLPIPSETQPGSYSLELIVYRTNDGIPLPLPDLDNSIWGQRLHLTQVDLIP